MHNDGYVSPCQCDRMVEETGRKHPGITIGNRQGTNTQPNFEIQENWCIEIFRLPGDLFGHASNIYMETSAYDEITCSPSIFTTLTHVIHSNQFVEEGDNHNSNMTGKKS